MSNLTTLTLTEARQRLDRRDISAVELTNAYLDRIAQDDQVLGAYLHVMHEVALGQAAAADTAIAAGQAGILTGIPVALKDVLCTTDAPTTAASRILEGFVPPYDATVVRRLREAGAVFLGKANTDEFAMGSSNENSAYKVVRNPWNTGRVPGGSSGGPAAAVAGELALVSLGSDTGGSIRQPAGFCGVVGVKPTYGRVSRLGLLAFASSLDQIGPFARTVEDAAITLQAIAGHDPQDSTSSPVAVPDFRAALSGDVRGMKLGVAKQYNVEGMEPGVSAAVEAAIARLADLGAEIIEVDLPHTEYALPTYYITAPAEASANLSRYDGVKYGLAVEAATLASRNLRPHAARGWAGGQTPHHARHLCAEFRLLRCLLCQGAKSAHADQAGFRSRMGAGRCHRRPNLPTVAFPLGSPDG
ncbi:MAG: amidase family protein [Thermomicrobiales bacterium]